MRPAAAPDPGPFQIGSGGLATHPGLLLDPPKWPSESSQGNHLLFFYFDQDAAHIDEGYMPHAEINVPGHILVGRFSGDPHWLVLVTPEACVYGLSAEFTNAVTETTGGHD